MSAHPTQGSAGCALVVYVRGADELSVARRVLTEHLEARGLSVYADDAVLVASELLTNAILHSGGPAELAVTTVADVVRLEVRDFSLVPPLQVDAGADSMTGRGMRLVDRLADRWGVEVVPGGKVVWAVVTAEPTARDIDSEALLAAWGDDLLEHATIPSTTATVDLGEVPTSLLRDAKAHVDNLVREFTLMAAGARSGMTPQVEPVITQLVDVVVHGFAEPRQVLKRLAADGVRSGHSHVRLTLPVSTDIDATVVAGEAYLQALDQADAYCRAARLLTLEAPAQHRVFHRWYVRSYLEQLRAHQRGEVVPTARFDEHLLQVVEEIARAHRIADRAARLHSLAVALAAALTSEAVAAAVLEEGVTALDASGGVVMLASDSTTVRVPGAVGHDDTMLARLRDEHPDAPLPAAYAMRTGDAVWLESPEERSRRFPQLVDFEPGTVAMCAVPVSVGNRRLGALRFSFREPRLFDPEEQTFIHALAAQTAQALHRAELHRQRLDAVQRLQATLLPAGLPVIPGVELAAAYHPLTDSLDVGGDFYDVWRLEDRRWAFAVGDAAGSGPEAAATTGLVRHTLRALTAAGVDTGAALRLLNAALLEATGDRFNERFCTLVFGVLTSTGGAVNVELAGGGHPAPLMVHGSDVRVVPLGGTLLGAFEDIVVDRQMLNLHRGEGLVIVTDGATEARRDQTLLGLEGVAAAVRAAPSAPAMVHAVEQAVRQHSGGRLRDDLAILSLRVTGEGDALEGEYGYRRQ